MDIIKPKDLRERTLKDLFTAFEGIYGPSYECKYYPCHFSGQDCTFCFCPFYPCLNYDMGGTIKLTSNGEFVWSCQDCWMIHDRDFSEKVIFALSRYPRQRLVEEEWIFYSKILQELIYGEVRGEEVGDSYNLMSAILYDKPCEEVDETEFLAVRIENFSISSVKKLKNVSDAQNEVIIPVKDKGSLFGFKDGLYVVCGTRIYEI
jgi:hypothetical protein